MIKKSILVILPLLVATFACTLQEPEVQKTTLSTNSALLFSRYVAIGSGFTAGYQSGAITAKHQLYSYPYLMAKQAGVEEFKQPLMQYPGVGIYFLFGAGILELKYLDNPETPNSLVFDPVIEPAYYEDHPEFSLDMPYTADSVMFYPKPYHNLGVPGAYVQDLPTATTSTNSASGENFMFDVVLRNWAVGGDFTMLDQARAAYLPESVPSLITCWIGLNDILGYASNGGGDADLIDAASFKDYFAQSMDTLGTVKQFGTTIVVANIPDITALPFFTTIQPYVIDSVTNVPVLDNSGQPVPLLGVDPVNDYVLLSAAGAIEVGYGVPEAYGGNGENVPPSVVLTGDEMQFALDATAAFNMAIQEVCDERGILLIDMNSFFNEVRQYGYLVGGHQFTCDFITGGIFSLDGVHPTDLGSAIIANKWLMEINRALPVNVPLVDIASMIRNPAPAPEDSVNVLRNIAKDFQFMPQDIRGHFMN